MSVSKQAASYTLEGHVSVRAALVSGNREVFEIIMQKGKRSRASDALQKRAREKRVKVSWLERPEIDSLAQGQTHGGVIAKVGERNFKPLAELGEGPSAGFVAMLAGVEDPYNFGQGATFPTRRRSARTWYYPHATGRQRRVPSPEPRLEPRSFYRWLWLKMN